MVSDASTKLQLYNYIFVNKLTIYGSINGAMLIINTIWDVLQLIYFVLFTKVNKMHHLLYRKVCATSETLELSVLQSL